MKKSHPSHPPRRAGAPLVAGRLALGRHVPNRLRSASLSAAVAACVFATLALPASAGTTLVSGTSLFNTACQAPVGAVPTNLGDYPAIDFSGSLDGCWYTYVATSQFNPSGTYVEQGSELFVGCLNGTACGTFETTYTFTGKYTDDTFAHELHGRCEHRIVGGTGDFAGAIGVITFKDDVVNMTFDYRGQIQLAPTGQPGATATLDATSTRQVAGPARTGGC